MKTPKPIANDFDGQHRFEACKSLGLPIHYEVSNVDFSQAIKILNDSQKKLDIKTYIINNASQGIQGYSELLEFINNNGINPISFSLNLCLIHGWTSNIKKGNPIKLSPSRYVALGFYNYAIKHISFAKSNSFTEAVYLLSNKATDDQMNILSKNILTIPKQLNYKEYLVVFENIINYKKRTNLIKLT